MDLEGTNGRHHLDEGISIGAHEEISSHDKNQDDFNNPTETSDDFFFGKNGMGADFHAGNNTIPPNFTSNSNDKFTTNELHVGSVIEDDFGPETDVDATDEKVTSPLSPSGYDIIEEVGDEMVPTGDHQMGNSELVKKPEENDNIPNPFGDNRFMDNVSSDRQTENFDEDEPELPNKIDFSEKRAYGEFDEDDDDDDEDDGVNDTDITRTIHQVPYALAAECEQYVLPTNNQVPVESVVVADSGDDSEDEWNYIKVDKEKLDRVTPVEFGIEENKDQPEQVTEGDFTSPTPPTASFGEAEFVNQQSHAIAEEVCNELFHKKQDSEQPDLFDSDHIERSSSVAAEHDSDLGNDQDLEEMDSQLNPDAKEFVPVSPQHSSIGSPFGNGGIHNRLDLLDDDVVSQSPRKGSGAIMDDNDIVLPAENDFTEISQRPSELVANELNFDPVQCENENLISDAQMKDGQRPESSSSQCSYQEMNLKEAMHGDEKQELAAEVPETENPFASGDTVPTANGDQQFLNEENPMNMSFYKDHNNPFSSGEVDMNAVQQLPDYIDDEGHENDISDFVAQPIAFEGGMNDHNDRSNGEDAETTNIQGIIGGEMEKLTPITNFVQELASEVTSILNEVEQRDTEQQPINTGNTSMPKVDADVINMSGSWIKTDEFASDVRGSSFDVIQKDFVEPVIQGETVNQLVSQENIQNAEQFIPEENQAEPILEPSMTEIPIPHSIESEPELQPEPMIESSVSEAVVADEAIAKTTATVAAATVGVVKAAKTITKPTDLKKTETKGKVAPIKKSNIVTSKVSTKQVSSKTDEKPKVATTRVAPRTNVVPKANNTTDRKPIISSTARKPLSNGTGSTSNTIKKTTPTTASAPRLVPGTARPTTTTSRPTTARTSGVSTNAPKTATTAIGAASAGPRVPLSARPATKPTAPSKGATSKSTTSSLSSTASRVKAAPTTSTLRTSTLGKPKTIASERPGVTRTSVSKVSPIKPSTTTKSPTAKTALASSATTKMTSSTRSNLAPEMTSSRKPLTTAARITQSKSPKVPTTNGVVSKTKVSAKSVAAPVLSANATVVSATIKDDVSMNGAPEKNGHIEKNGTGAENIIDVSAD